MKFRTWFIVGLITAAGLSAFAADDPFNVDVFFGWDGYYRPMDWTPVEVGIDSDLKEAFGGAVSISAQQDGLNTLNIRHPFVLTPGGRLNLPLVSKLSFNADKCDVSIIDRSRERIVWNQRFHIWDFTRQNTKLKVVNENDLLIGLIGKNRFGIKKLPDFTMCAITGTNVNVNGKVCIGHKVADMAPWDWTGYSSLDLLILYDPDWSLFRTQQLKAMAQWVSKGGKMLIVGAANPIDKSNPIASLLPFETTEKRQVTLTDADLQAFKLKPDSPQKVVALSVFAEQSGKMPIIRSSETGQNLFFSHRTGFGIVGLAAFDPASLSDNQKTNSPHFWVNCITMLLEGKPSKYKSDFKAVSAPLDENRNNGRHINVNNLKLSSIRTIRMRKNSKDVGINRNYFYTGLSQAGTNSVMEYLYNIDEMQPLGIWPVIFLLLLLALLVGPIDYIVLKRKDRLPLTWITSAFWILVFSFGAYHGVQALRGGDMQMRHVSIIDGIKGADSAWRTNYSGLFAPRSDDYRLDNVGEKQWFSAAAPVERQIYSYRRQSASRNIYCQQYDGSNIPVSLPINIWTMQCLLNETRSQTLPISAVFDRDGDHVTVTLDNYSSSDLNEGYILFDGNKYLQIGPVPAKTTGKVFSGRLGRGKNWNLSLNEIASTPGRSGRHFQKIPLQVEKVFSARGNLRRSRAINQYLESGAAVVCARFDDAPVPYGVENKSCQYEHVQLVRLVVLPGDKSKDVAYDTN